MLKGMADKPSESPAHKSSYPSFPTQAIFGPICVIWLMHKWTCNGLAKICDVTLALLFARPPKSPIDIVWYGPRHLLPKPRNRAALLLHPTKWRAFCIICRFARGPVHLLSKFLMQAITPKTMWIGSNVNTPNPITQKTWFIVTIAIHDLSTPLRNVNMLGVRQTFPFGQAGPQAAPQKYQPYRIPPVLRHI